MDRLIIHNIFNRYAGWLGSVAARYEENGKLSEVIPSLEEGGHRLAVIAGTSTCHLVQVHISSLSSEPITADFDITLESPRYLRGWSMGSFQGISSSRSLIFRHSQKKLLGHSYQWMVDGRRWPIVNWTGSLRVLFFCFVYLTIIRS